MSSNDEVGTLAAPMAAPTTPSVVPAVGVRELVERLRLFADADVMETARDGTFEYNDGVKWSGLMVEAADMLERLANRPSLTEDEREQVRREALEEAARSAQAWRVIPEDFIVPGAMSAEELVIARRTAKGIEDHLRALADRSEPRQEKEGGRG